MKHDPNHLTARDMFLMSTLNGIIEAIVNDPTQTAHYKLKVLSSMAPDLAATGMRIADAVMAERAKADK